MERVGLDELLGGGARIDIHYVQAAAEVLAVVVQLGAAGQQQMLVLVEELQVRIVSCWRTARLPGLSEGLDDVGAWRFPEGVGDQIADGWRATR